MGTDYASRHSAKKKRKLLRKDGAVDVDELDGVQDEEEKAGKKRERRKRPKVPLTTTHPARLALSSSLKLKNVLLSPHLDPSKALSVVDRSVRFQKRRGGRRSAR